MDSGDVQLAEQAEELARKLEDHAQGISGFSVTIEMVLLDGAAKFIRLQAARIKEFELRYGAIETVRSWADKKE